MTCDECVEGVAGFPLFFFFRQNATEDMLAEHFCKDPTEHCPAHGYAQNWLPEVLDRFIGQEAGHLCDMMVVCRENEKDERFISCVDCKYGMHFITNHLSSEHQVAQHVAYLQGEGHCGQHPDNADCPDHVAEFYPQLHHYNMVHTLNTHINEMCADQCGGRIIKN